MARFVFRTLRRLVGGVVMVLVVMTFTFFLVRWMPGNPVMSKLQALIQQGVPMAQAKMQIASMYDFVPNDPLYLQYYHFISNVFHFNLGQSIAYNGISVVQLLGAAMPWTIVMVMIGTLVSFVIGVISGVIGAVMRNHWSGGAITLLSSFLHGIPQFLLGLLLAFLFTTIWQVFPFGAPYSVSVQPSVSLPFIGSVAWHAVLPIAVYAISGYGGWALTMKSSVVSVLGDDFILAAELRGITRSIRWRYLARNAILPLFTGLTLSLGFMFGGAIFIETIFDYPGLGHLLLTSMGNYDYPAMDGAFALITAAVVLSNIIADLLYSIIDPRIKAAA